jgi:hypothetical protein
MVLVRPKFHELTVVNGGDHPAQRFAYAAKRRLVLYHLARFIHTAARIHSLVARTVLVAAVPDSGNAVVAMSGAVRKS